MKPMLACSTIPALEDIKYPVYASVKSDGIRGLIIDGKLMSRNLKLIPNHYIRAKLSKPEYNGLDGEILMTHTKDFNQIQSIVMSAAHVDQDKFYFKVFDDYRYSDRAFSDRVNLYLCRVFEINLPYIKATRQVMYWRKDQLEVKYNTAIEAEEEGLIVRDPKGPYKHGRSTMNQGWMLKLKPKDDDEGTIVDFIELEHEDGTRGNVLGALVIEWNDLTFKLGTGFNAVQREFIWRDREDYLGRTVTFKYMGVGTNGKPRHGSFKGFRENG